MKKKVLIILIVFVVLIAAVIYIHVTSSRKTEFTYDGWINCMPPLSKDQAKLCEDAEAANYPYIAY